MIRLTPILLLAAALTASGAARNSQPNILLIVDDDQPPNTIRALGNPYIDTPNLDRLVREGSAFTRAIVANPHCVPSRAEIMTGASGFRNFSPPFGEGINPQLVLWADTMRSAGYHTWYSGKWMNDGNPLTRGYEEVLGMYAGGGGAGGLPLTYPITEHNELPVMAGRSVFRKSDAVTPDLEKGIGRTPETDRHIADAAIEFIRRRTDKPFFLHVNFVAAHDPRHIHPTYKDRYDPAAMPLPPNFLPDHPFDHGNMNGRDELLIPSPRSPELVKAEVAAMYAVVSYMDDQIGRMLNALRESGQYENTIIIFSSDHGVGIGSHGIFGKQNMYEHTIGVPLVMAGPGIPKNQRFEAQTYLRDLYPTVCDLTGVPIPETVEGKSLVPVLKGLAREIYPEIYAYWNPNPRGQSGQARRYDAELPIQRMVRTDRWKLIYYSHLDRYQLFDLTNDPHELRDLAGNPEYGGVEADLRRKLQNWFGPRIEQHRMEASLKGS